MSDSHGSHGHGAATADPHAHGSHGHDAHGHDAHGAGGHGGGHGHDEAPHQTPVAPWEPTPWAAIVVGIAVTAIVVFLGVTSKWNETIKNNPNSRLGAPGQSAVHK